MARGCGAKHICKSKYTKHHIRGAILEVAMLKSCTPLWREAHLQVKMHKTPHCRSHFGNCDVEKLHAAVARKHHIRGAILEVAMLKNCTPLWREAHLQVKMHKTPHCRSHFGSCDVEKLHAAVARSTFASENAQNTAFAEPFWKLRCWKIARRCGAKHICKWKCTKHLIVGAKGIILASCVGIIINHCKDPYWTTRNQWKVRPFFSFSWLTCNPMAIYLYMLRFRWMISPNLTWEMCGNH